MLAALSVSLASSRRSSSVIPLSAKASLITSRTIFGKIAAIVLKYRTGSVASLSRAAKNDFMPWLINSVWAEISELSRAYEAHLMEKNGSWQKREI